MCIYIYRFRYLSLLCDICFTFLFLCQSINSTWKVKLSPRFSTIKLVSVFFVTSNSSLFITFSLATYKGHIEWFSNLTLIHSHTLMIQTNQSKLWRKHEWISRLTFFAFQVRTLDSLINLTRMKIWYSLLGYTNHCQLFSLHSSGHSLSLYETYWAIDIYSFIYI